MCVGEQDGGQRVGRERKWIDSALNKKERGRWKEGMSTGKEGMSKGEEGVPNGKEGILNGKKGEAGNNEQAAENVKGPS